MGIAKKDEMNPSWWTEKHASAWDRVKDAFARDWDQTKADFSKTKGQELNQNVADTVKQAAGKEPIPGKHVANVKEDDFQNAEPALRYGYGASSQYPEYQRWDDKLESRLRSDWDKLHADRKFDDVKMNVRKAWERARGA